MLSSCASPPPFALAPQARLTRRQYVNTLAALFDRSAQPSATTLGLIPEDPGGSTFSYDVLSQAATGDLVSAYANVAAEVAHSPGLPVSALAPCAPGSAPAACGREFVARFGRRAFRRPLDAAELERWATFFAGRLAADGYEQAVRLTIEAFLQAPQLVFLLEEGRPATDPSGAYVLTSHERAGALAYLLTDRPPDATLSARADAGDLDDPAIVRVEASRLLASAAGREVVKRFNQEWLTLDKIGPQLTRKLRGVPLPGAALTSLRAGLELFAASAYEGDAGLSGLLTTPRAFVDGNTADLYGVPRPAAGASMPTTVIATPLDPKRRAGLLTQAGWLALHANEDGDAPVRRGVFVLDHLICLPPPPPPANVNTTIRPPGRSDPPRTTRMRLEQVHSPNPECAGCHRLFDGVGFAFGHYDATGSWRDHEQIGATTLPIDATGALFGTDVDGPFNGAVELSARLARSQKAHACFAAQWLRFGLGRTEGPTDVCTIERASAELLRTGRLADVPISLALLHATSPRRAPDGPSGPSPKSAAP
jgi:hypothetical protein